MIRLSRFLAATMMAFLMGLFLSPARAAAPPTGSALAVEAGSRAIMPVQYYHHRVYRAPRYTRPHYYRPVGYHRPVYRHRVYGRPVYRHRHYGRPYYGRRHYGRPVYYTRPVYRRCVTRPRTVWTPYGYERRWVRVCR